MPLLPGTAYTWRIDSFAISFLNNQDKSSISIVHCGPLVTGFPLIVHGGILGALLDEALARTAFMNFAIPTGVTANLHLTYKYPTVANQFIVIKTKTEKVENSRKAQVSGVVESLDGNLLLEASGLFVQPKSYKLKSMEGL